MRQQKRHHCDLDSNANPMSSSNQHYKWENKRVSELNGVKGVPNDLSIFECLI